MGTLLAPRCDECGAMANECPEGYLLLPATMEVVCFQCYEPDQAKREEITRAAIRDGIARFKEEHGRLPDGDELIEWFDGNVDGERDAST
jgi:hypothetical protein